jgi:NAD(P)-dependent dehydrogenase (short-subunit alcohol dehydrogenase family)
MLFTRLKPFSSSSKLLALHPRHSSSHASDRTAIQGKKCVVTGASRGIGLAIARRFAYEGADTVLVGRDSATLQKAVEQVKSECEGRGSHIARAGDVAQRQFWEDLQRELVSDIRYNPPLKTKPTIQNISI